VSVKVSSVAALYSRAHNMRFHIWHRRDLNRKVAAITALVAPSASEAASTGKGLPWATGYHSGPMKYFDVIRPVSEQLDWLMREDPAYLMT
jgi:hypothetical protein